MMAEQWHWMICQVIRRTDKAVLIQSEDMEAWIPYAMIQAYEGELESGESVNMAISFNMAERKGFIVVDRSKQCHGVVN